MRIHMITLFFTVGYLFLSDVVAGNEFKNPRSYGEPIGNSPAVSLKDILAAPHDYNKQTVQFEAIIDEVCQNKGCWMWVMDGTNRLRIDFKNYGFFIPWDSKGKRARLEGKVYHKLVDKNILKHWAEDSNDPAQNPDDITEDKMMVLFTASGVVVEEGSELSDEQRDVVEGRTTKEH